MLFTQLTFFVFFGLVFALTWSTRSLSRRKLVLLIASYVFYAAWDWRFLSLIFASTLIDDLAARRIHRATSDRARRGWLIASLGLNLGMLGIFKYFNFFIDSAAALLEPLGLGTSGLDIVLPVGISFFTFQTMSYTIDVYRRRLEPVADRLDFALFVAFFPQLVAGPIVRASAFLPQLRRLPRWPTIAVRRCLSLFLIGFVKKACIADSIAPQVESVFSEPSVYTVGAVWIAVLLYAVQIYCDFSGYTDMAIAIAGLLGYDLGRNFDFPYLATSLPDFWRRWHISLSTWLRDYLYIPLGGNRGGRLATVRNLMLTMLLGGLWHGAAWTFVAWGGIHGVALAVDRGLRAGLGGRSLPAAESAILVVLRRTLGMASTLFVVCCAWIFFRAASFGDAWILLRAFAFGHSQGTVGLDARWIILLSALAVLHWTASRWPFERMAARLPEPAFAAAYGTAAALAIVFLPLRAEPFIYFQF